MLQTRLLFLELLCVKINAFGVSTATTDLQLYFSVFISMPWGYFDVDQSLIFFRIA